MNQPPDNPTSQHLDRSRAAEDSTYDASIRRLGDTATLVDDFLDAHQAFGDYLRLTKDPPGHLYVASLLFLAATYELDRGCLNCLRGRLSDAVQATRRAIEAAGFAARIANHPHLAKVWRRACESDEAYERYREKFAPSLIFPTDDPLLAKLRKRWDHGSREYHMSIFSIASRASIQLNAESLEFNFRQFELQDDDLAEPARTLLYVLDTDFGIMAIFERVFADQLGDNLRSWLVRKNALDAKIGIHKAKWRSVISPNTDREVPDAR